MPFPSSSPSQAPRSFNKPGRVFQGLRILAGAVLLGWLSTATGRAEEALPRWRTQLEAGQPQHVVIYGTSLSKGGTWVGDLKRALDNRFPGLVTVSNGAKGGQNSRWGLENVGTNVIAYRPDVVFIEFAINDSVARFDLSLAESRRNLEAIIDRITTALPRCEIVLQIMNPVVGKREGDPSYRRDQEKYQQIYREVGQARGLRVIDHSIAWRDLLKREGEAGFLRYVRDGVHPSPEGYAKFVTPTLLRAIGLEPPSGGASNAGDLAVPLAATPPVTLLVLRREDADESWLATLTGLQGLVARQGGREQLYLTEDGTGHALWPQELARVHGVKLVPVTSPERVFRQLAPAARGYIRFDAAKPESVNAATLLATLHDAVIVDRSHEAAVQAAGLACLGDGTTESTKTILESNRVKFADTVVAEQSGERLWGLRDYLVMGRVAATYDGDLAGLVGAAAGRDRAVFGWGNPADGGERHFIERNSRLALFTIPSDHASNLSVLSAFRAPQPPRQKAPAGPSVITDRQTHLVTFVLTDGDNAGWVLGSFAGNKKWFGNPSRGHFPMGYGLAPSLVDLAPDALAWFYAQAADTETGRDSFVAGPSGAGYFFPSFYPAAALREHTTRLNALLARADLRIVQILDEDALDRTDLWAQYLRQPQIDGLIYLDYAPYNKGQGRIVWAEGKPVVSARALLWSGLRGGDPASVIRQLNAAHRDLTSADGYTIVSVHAWSQTLADVEAVVRQLEPGVRVVTPDVFFATLRANLRPPSP
jgi:lysophospholipase L1-like esterase